MPATIVTTQFLLPGYVVSNGETTGNPWTYPNNILYVDNNLAVADVNQGAASDMIIGGFNPNLDQSAVIVGIEIKLISKVGADTVPPTTLTIYAVDNTTGEDVFYPYTAPVEPSLDLDTLILGNSTYLFDQEGFTPDQINNLKIQMIANGNLSVDSLLMNIYYYLPDVPTPPTPGPGCPTCNSPIQVPEMFLQLPFNIGDTVFYLTPGSLQYPDCTPVQPGDLGDCGGEIDFVFDQGQIKGIGGNNFEENVVLDISSGSWEVLANGVVKVDIGSTDNRGIMFHTPYTHDEDLMSDHDAGTPVIISNSARFESRFLRTCQVSRPSIYFAAESMNPTITNPCSDLTKVETESNFINYWVLDFSDSGLETAFFTLRMPDNWDGNPMTFQFTWTNDEGEEDEVVEWSISGICYADGDTIDSPLGDPVFTDDTWINNGVVQTTIDSDPVTPSGNLAPGNWATFQIQRNVEIDNNLTGDARLMGVKMTYGTNYV